MFIDAYCLSIEFCSDLLIEYVHIFIYIYISFESVKTTKMLFVYVFAAIHYILESCFSEDPCFNLRPTFAININHGCREIHHPKIDPSWVNLQLGCVGCVGYIGDYRGFCYPVIW